MFNFSLVQELYKSVTKKREGFDRCLVWCCILAIAFHVVIFEGNSSISFLFTSAKLGWNLSDYSIYSGTHLFISIIGMLLMLKFAGSVLRNNLKLKFENSFEYLKIESFFFLKIFRPSRYYNYFFVMFFKLYGLCC